MKPGELLGGRFEIERLVATGGMGSIHRARDVQTGLAVALKTLHTRAAPHVERFERETHVLAELDHPGIVRYVAHGETALGELYLAMEWLDGEDLSRRLARGRLGVQSAVHVVGAAADALSAAHGRGVLHRDVKPSNLVLGRGEPPDVKLLDFGIARIAMATRATRTGSALGTPAYMAPEQARGLRDVDARVDVFSLGCVLFECLTGRPAFEGDNPMAIFAKVLLDDAPRPSDVVPDLPPALVDLVARMLAKDREQRPRDAGVVLAELQAIHVENAPPGRSAPRPPALTGGERRLLCVLLASNSEEDGPARSTGPDPTAPTLVQAGAGATTELRVRAAEFGGRLEVLPGGEIAITLSGVGSAGDQVLSAARCALELRGFLPDARITLATGWGVVSERWPLGEVIDRAAELQAAAPRRPDTEGELVAIRIDDITAGLLDERFEVKQGSGGLDLVGAQEDTERFRTLLGRTTPCVGRETELAALAAALDDCFAECTPRAVVLTGPPGVGKSRVAHEAIRRARERIPSLEVWVGRGDPLSAGSPFGMIAMPLRRALGIRSGEPVEVRRDKLASRVARHTSGMSPADRARVTCFLSELVGVPLPDGDASELQAARRDPFLMGDQMRRAWKDLLAAECATHPLLLLMEDLHWGDAPSVQFIDSALGDLEGAPLFVLALARPEVEERLGPLWINRSTEQVRLPELTRKASARLVHAALGEEVSPARSNELSELSGGNAFYLEELIRAEAAGQGGELPGTVVAMAQARLERLDSGARRVLRAASVFGDAFWPGGVTALLGGETGASRVDAWLRALVEREVILKRTASRFRGERELAFRHALLREAAYETLLPDDRALGHRLAAAWLEAAGETDPMLLAQHNERGGERGAASKWYGRAAEQALEGHDLDAALERAELAVACGASGEMLGALRLIEAEVKVWRGDFAHAERCAEEACRLLSRGSALWYRAAGCRAFTLGRRGGPEDVAGAARDLESIEPDEALAGTHAIALARAVRELLFASRLDLAEPFMPRISAVALARGGSDALVLGWARYLHAIQAGLRGEYDARVRFAESAVQAFREAGDARFMCAVSPVYANALLRVGELADWERVHRETLDAADRLGLTNVAAACRHNLSMALLLGGDLPAAAALERAAVQACAAHGDSFGEATSRSQLARVLLRMGDTAGAERETIVAAAMVAGAQPRLSALVLCDHADVLLGLGRPGPALAAARVAMDAQRQLGPASDSAARVRLALAEALRASGETAAASVAIGEARAELETQAAAIRDPAFREGFLERVPENARTLALAAEWAGSGRR